MLELAGWFPNYDRAVCLLLETHSTGKATHSWKDGRWDSNRRATIKKQNPNASENAAHLWWERKLVRTQENTVQVLPKPKKRTTIWRHLPTLILKPLFTKYMLQKPRHVSTHEWMRCQVQNEAVFCYKEELCPLQENKTRDHIKWNKPDSTKKKKKSFVSYVEFSSVLFKEKV